MPLRAISLAAVAVLALLSLTSVNAQQTPYLGSPVSLPGTVQAENYDLGGEGVAWHDTTAGNAFGPVYRTHDMDVGPINAGGYHIGVLADGEWAEYTVNVATTGGYTMIVRYASAYPNTTRFRVLVNGVDVSGAVSITSTGDWQAYTTKSVPVSLTAGTNRVLRINFEVGAFNLDSLQFTSSGCTAPAIITHPVGRNIGAGNTAALTAAASGTMPLSYQWFRNGVAIPGATGTSYTITNAEQGKDGGSYTFRATNACGSATSNAAVIRIPCQSPDEERQNINRALRGLGDVCDWTEGVQPNFPLNFGGGKSYNLAVLSATTAFIREPIRSTGTKTWNMYTWWTEYLRGELGDRGTAWYYGGQELGSYIYQHFNLNCVLAVHYHAQITGQTTIRDLARRWLRASFALHALAASPGPVATLHSKGQFINSGGYNGPYIGMAGMRSSWKFWDASDRSILFSQAVGIATNKLGEYPSQREIREWVEPRWPVAGVNVYGFNSTEQAQLRALVTNATLPPSFVATYLGTGLRTQVRYHFVAWPGVKVTLMERNTHTSTAPTYGVAFFTAPRAAAGREAHFLYPWQGLFVEGDTSGLRGITQGEGRIDVTSSTNRYIWATNGTDSSFHPQETPSIEGLPLGPRSYWIVLDPAAPPSVQ